MNILMALSQLEITGAEVYAATLGNELTKRGHRVFYASDTLSVPVQGVYIPICFNKRSWPRRIWQIIKLVWVIKKHRIQLVHAHSRASGWSSFIACKLTRTPMLTTVHGRQPVHASRKTFHAFGYKAIAVCEDIRAQIISDLKVPSDRVVTIPNGIQLDSFPLRSKQYRSIPVVSIIGRLTGPKGELCFQLINKVLQNLVRDKKIKLNVYSASQIPAQLEDFQDIVNFCGYEADLSHAMGESDLVIGAGRVAIESLLIGVPLYAVGEAKCIGFITTKNIDEAISSNFGDIGPNELAFDFQEIYQAITSFVKNYEQTISAENALSVNNVEIQELRNKASTIFDLKKITDRIELLYQDTVVETLKREMPILMYHRFISEEREKGIHGTWIDIVMFEKHLKLIKQLGFETLTFQDLEKKGFIHRLTYGKKFLVLTVDDGYQDNLTLMLPLLKKYGFKAVVFIVSNEAYNRWDVEHPTHPDTKVPLLTAGEIKTLSQSGYIEIGGHTLSHANLTNLGSEEQRHEILENKNYLEAIIGQELRCFAYPYGYLNENAKREVRAAGYSFAVSTDSGPRAIHQDPYQIRRINVFPKTTVFGLWRKIRGNYTWRR